jgi:hypothetical protein
MIFVPSVGGISHNVIEHTEPADLAAGANILLRVMLRLAGTAATTNRVTSPNGELAWLAS